MNTLQAIAVYGGITLALFLIIALLVMLPTADRTRYRPGVAWWAAPVWFNGPDQAQRTKALTGGDAEDASGRVDHSHTEDAGEAVRSGAPVIPTSTGLTPTGGGASARW